MGYLLAISQAQGKLLVEAAESGETVHLSRSRGNDPAHVWVTPTGAKYQHATLNKLVELGLLQKGPQDGVPWYRIDYEPTKRGAMLAFILKPLLPNPTLTDDRGVSEG